MNDQMPNLQIRVYETNGTARVFTQSDAELANETLAALNPEVLFAGEHIKMGDDDDSETTLIVSGLARIDFLTEQLSVWDFPFVLGAPLELTESEFCDCRDNPQRWDTSSWHNSRPIFLEVETAGGQRYFFWMEVAGGLSAVRKNRVHSLFKRQSMVFSLRTGGIGILNLANVTEFAVHPEPPDEDYAAMDESELSHNSWRAVGI